jgi:hypothetical protein
MLGSSPATKLLLPLEFASLLRPVMDLAQQASRTDGISGKGA